MRRFTCPTCDQQVHFRNQSCVVCGTALAYAPLDRAMRAAGPGAQLCANAQGAGCNWMARRAEPGCRCLACEHNLVVPNMSLAGTFRLWSEIELAKRMLFYQILRWSMPHPDRIEDPEYGLGFEFKADAPDAEGKIAPVMTGHHNGLITLNIAESDDAVRVARRTALNEPYRTLIGHMRHEIAHYYWQMLVENSPYLDRFRALFGDETADYGAALQTYYDTGAPPDWRGRYISAYATAHPWEDFAETWAHWLHIVDGIETAQAYGLMPGPGPGDAPADPLHGIDPYLARDVGPVIDAWVPVTVAVNDMNRGMGQPDLYPFVLSAPVLDKLQFINDLIGTARAL